MGRDEIIMHDLRKNEREIFARHGRDPAIGLNALTK
jgi:hypothetical protein